MALTIHAASKMLATKRWITFAVLLTETEMNDANTLKREKIVRVQELLTYLKVSRATIYRWRKDGSFPSPIYLGKRTICWKESTINEWIAARETI